MRSRCVDGRFHRSAVHSRRTSALLHLTIRSSRIRWSQRITPQIPKTTPPASPVINTPIHAVLEPVLTARGAECSQALQSVKFIIAKLPSSVPKPTGPFVSKDPPSAGAGLLIPSAIYATEWFEKPGTVRPRRLYSQSRTARLVFVARMRVTSH